MADAKKDWLARSKATHGDGNLGKSAGVKGKLADSPIGRYDGTKAQKPAKAANQATKTPAVFGNKSGGGKSDNGPTKVTYPKGLMQKGK